MYISPLIIAGVFSKSKIKHEINREYGVLYPCCCCMNKYDCPDVDKEYKTCNGPFDNESDLYD